mgnify:CR=1 FL=1
MDKRFFLFIALSFGIIVTWSVARVKFGPPPKPVAAKPDEANQDGAAAEQDAAQAGSPQAEGQASGKGREPAGDRGLLRLAPGFVEPHELLAQLLLWAGGWYERRTGLVNGVTGGTGVSPVGFTGGTPVPPMITNF